MNLLTKLKHALFGPPKVQFQVVGGRTECGRTFTELTAENEGPFPLLRIRVYSDGSSQLISSGSLHIHSDGQLQLSSRSDLHLAHPSQQRTIQVVDPDPVVDRTRREVSVENPWSRLKETSHG